jgi:lipopolysaccharide transport system ATP-binding protein
MTTSISFKNVFKTYSSSFFSKAKDSIILENINFDILSGETFGIVGLNGAGKSTLLKLMTGLTKPTSGVINVNGKFTSLIELGGAFNIDLNGIDNIYIECELLGYSHTQIRNFIPKISNFSELGETLLKPLKIYSTGMKMRLAFAISTVERPDILIIDEALSVGDEYFQHKCFDLINNFKKLGTTIVLVSHDKSAILSLCDKVLLLVNKTIYDIGIPKLMLEKYNELISPKNETLKNRNNINSFGSLKAHFIDFSITDDNNQILETYHTNQKVLIKTTIVINEFIERLVFGYSLKDKYGNIVYGTNSHHTNQTQYSLPSGRRLIIQVEVKLSIAPGTYSLNLALTDGMTHLNNNYHWIDNSLFITVINPYYYFEGFCNLNNSIEISNL